MSTLILDIDGVLNGHEKHPNGYCGIRPDCAERLNRILDACQPRVVISSSWRYLVLSGQMNEEGFASLLLTHGVKVTEVQVVGPDIDDGTLRGSVIHKFAETNPGTILRPLVILDDAPNGMLFFPYADCLYRTNGETGLTDADVENVIRLLKGEAK